LLAWIGPLSSTSTTGIMARRGLGAYRRSEAALGVVTPLLEAPVADQRNWTIARLRAEIVGQAGISISRSQLSKVLRKKNFRWRRPRRTLKGRQIADEIERVGLRLQLRKAQAEAGDIVLLYGDESEALTHPYLARAWAKRGADLRVPAPGQAKKVAMMIRRLLGEYAGLSEVELAAT
jgi:hypothetical protein